MRSTTEFFKKNLPVHAFQKLLCNSVCISFNFFFPVLPHFPLFLCCICTYLYEFLHLFRGLFPELLLSG